MSEKVYVDLQINGYMGIDFADPELTEEKFLVTAENILKSGTKVFLPTLVTSSRETYFRNIRLMAEAVERHGLKQNIPGVHLEGPFISSEKGAIGAHLREYVQSADCSYFDELMERANGFIALMTVAAELPNVTALIRHASKQGVVVSCGHQMAGTDDLKEAARAGAKLLTHLGNGCPNQIDRHKNMIWAGMACDELAAMIITDGHHLPDELVKCIIRCKGVDNIIVTSDAAPIAGFPPGRYNCWGNDAILAENGRFYNPEKGCLVGSSVCMKDCAVYLEKQGFSEADIEKMTLINPLRILGRDTI